MKFLDRDSLAEILAHAASADRTVLEFRSAGDGAEREVRVLDITEHVETLEAAGDETDGGEQ